MTRTASPRLVRRAPLLGLLLLLLHAAPAGAQPAIGSGRGGIAPVLEGRDARSDRVEVDAAIASAIARERVHDHDGAVAGLQAAVQRTRLSDAKARYFLARAYLERAKARGATDAAGARQDRALALVHLRAVPGLARASALPEDARWATEARARLRSRARSGPLLDQHTAGGRYPWGYCGVASLRMVLRLEGLPDPGADVVALQGAAPYSPGAGSDPHRLAARARELGLQGASYTSAGRLADLVASIDQGRPVLVAGVGPFSATLEGGGVKARSYPSGHWLVAVGWEADASGALARVVLNDPDGGRRLRMTRAEFLRFFAPEGDGAIWAIRYAR